MIAAALSLALAAAPAPCALDVLLDYEGDEPQPLYTVLPKAGFPPAHRGLLKSPHARTDLYFAPACADRARALGKALALAPDAVQPVTWKTPYGLTLAVSKAETERLDAAAATGDIAKVRAALLPTAEWRRALKGALEKPELPLVRLLVEGGLPLSTAFGGNPLSAAAGNGQVELVKLLLDLGAAVDAEGPRGTPLAAAAAAGQLETARLLLDRGAKPSSPSGSSEAPLFVAETAAMAELLLARGARPGDADASGLTAVHVNHDPAVLALLAKRGARLDAGDRDGWTPLHVAAFRRDAEKVKTLLSLGADPNARTTRLRRIDARDEWTPELVYPAGSTPLDLLGSVASGDEGQDSARAVAAALEAAGGKRRGGPRVACAADDVKVELVGVAKGGAAYVLRSTCATAGAAPEGAPAGASCPPCGYPRLDGRCHTGMTLSLRTPGRDDADEVEIWADTRDAEQCTRPDAGSRALASAEAAFRARGVALSAPIAKLACTGRWPSVECALPASALGPHGVTGAAALRFSGGATDRPEGGMDFTLSVGAEGAGAAVLDTASCSSHCDLITFGDAWLSPDGSLLVYDGGVRAITTRELAGRVLASRKEARGK